MTDRRRVAPWREVARPHNDIIEGRYDPSVFAVNIYSVYTRRAPPDYQAPDRFFARTFLTRGLKDLLTSVMRRLSGQSNAEAVSDLVTSFGGGKTHALLCLLHLATGGPLATKWTGIKELLAESGLSEIPKARVVVLSGEDLDPTQGEKGARGEPTRLTMWGEFAWQLGGAKGYELVRENDEKRTPPSAEIITKVLSLSDANLILIDEALRYVSRARGIRVHETSLASQTQNFFLALTEAVSRTPKSSLVVTLPTSLLEMTREDEEDFKRLKKIFQRVEKTRRLAEGDEIYEIVRRRLFQNAGDPKEQRRSANAYFDYYRQHKDSFPEYATASGYLQKMQRAYPFHPEFLDVLNERWSSIPQFQRTRAVLRMLAILIGELFKHDSSPMIQISSTRLSKDFRSEVLEQLDARQFDAVIESDIAGTGARAAKIDQEGNQTYQREHVAEGVATAIFFYSFGGTATQPAATVPALGLAVLRPGLEPAFIPDAIQLLRKPITGLFYLESEGDRYRFTVTPNLNMILAEREASVNQDEIDKILFDAIQKQIGSRFRPIMFPDEPRDVQEQAQPSLVVLLPDETLGRQTRTSTEAKILEITKGGATFRKHRNCLIFSVPEEGHRMRESSRTLIALRDVERLYSRTNKLSDNQKSQLEVMLKDAARGLAQSIWRAYRFVVTPGPEDKLESFDMGVQIQRDDRKISDSIWDALVDRERLAPKIGPGRLTSKDLGVWPEDKNAMSTKDAREAFFTFTYLPMIPSVQALKDTIIQGVATGSFGFARGSLEENGLHSVKIGTTLDADSIEFSEDEFLLRSDFAYRLIGALPKKPDEPIRRGGAGGSGGEPGTVPRPAGTEVYGSVDVSVENLDWKKWAEFHEAVIQPLVNAGASVTVKVEVKGSSEEGISPNTVDLSIKEGLTQYGIPAKVEPKKRKD